MLVDIAILTEAPESIIHLCVFDEEREESTLGKASFGAAKIGDGGPGSRSKIGDFLKTVVGEKNSTDIFKASF
jgi:hypothetical protein